ncbi:MAG TPA: phosphoribosylformylglycinamidine synthase I [Spirochaetia bacterium]|nr:phosphoribosylformylglycinamidine synthase I [Spirochaetia bacterium]
MKPRVMVLRTDGTNCDEETFSAFNKAGGDSRLVHINQLRSGAEKLVDCQIMAIPGGFSYGDDVHSGKILAVELISSLKEQLLAFLAAGKPVLGICNGFQVLVRTGILPGGNPGTISVALMGNDSGHFECRWIKLRVEKSDCIFTRGLEGEVLDMMVAHGEGKLYTDTATLAEMENRNQVVFRYVGADGTPSDRYPENPNGSSRAVAGLCDPRGLVLGLMPHPERIVEFTQHPNWRRGGCNATPALTIFRNAVAYAREM